MSNNNVPTEPGFYYRGSDVVRVRMNPETNLYSGLVYYEHGMTGLLPVEDDGLWLGPVPMPGEWAPRGLVSDLIEAVERVQDWDWTEVGDCIVAIESAMPVRWMGLDNEATP